MNEEDRREFHLDAKDALKAHDVDRSDPALVIEALREAGLIDLYTGRIPEAFNWWATDDEKAEVDKTLMLYDHMDYVDKEVSNDAAAAWEAYGE